VGGSSSARATTTSWSAWRTQKLSQPGAHGVLVSAQSTTRSKSRSARARPSGVSSVAVSTRRWPRSPADTASATAATGLPGTSPTTETTTGWLLAASAAGRGAARSSASAVATAIGAAGS
jgi:hypothetical protein